MTKSSEERCSTGKSGIPTKAWLSYRSGPIALALLSSILLLASLKFPLWKMRLEAPQYREEEALNIAVYPSSFRGDLRELRVLNQYIGVHVPPTLPQFKWLPGVLITGAVLGLLAAILGGPASARILIVVASSVALALLVAAVQAKTQIHDIGHKRDQKTVLAGVHDFTPPFLGTSKIAQFTVTSNLGLAAWLSGSAIVLQLGAAWLSRRPGPIRSKTLQISRAAEVARFSPATASRIL